MQAKIVSYVKAPMGAYLGHYGICTACSSIWSSLATTPPLLFTMLSSLSRGKGLAKMNRCIISLNLPMRA